MNFSIRMTLGNISKFTKISGYYRLFRPTRQRNKKPPGRRDEAALQQAEISLPERMRGNACVYIN